MTYPIMQQESIPVGCILPACQPYVFRWPPLGVSTGGRSHVSSDDHKMSVVGAGAMSGI